MNAINARLIYKNARVQLFARNEHLQTKATRVKRWPIGEKTRRLEVGFSEQISKAHRLD